MQTLPVVFVTKNRQEIAFFAIQSIVAAANRARVKLQFHMYIGNDDKNQFFIWQGEMMNYWNKTYGHEFIPKRNDGDGTDGLAQGFTDMFSLSEEYFLWVDDDMFLEVDSLENALSVIEYKDVGSVSFLHPSGLDMKFTFNSIAYTNGKEVGNTKGGLDFQEFFIDRDSAEVVSADYAFPPMLVKTSLISDIDVQDFVTKCRGAILDNADQYITRHIKAKGKNVTLDTRAVSVHLGETFGSFSGTRMLNKIRKVVKCYETEKEGVFTTDKKEAKVEAGKVNGFWFNDDRGHLFSKFSENA